MKSKPISRKGKLSLISDFKFGLSIAEVAWKYFIAEVMAEEIIRKWMKKKPHSLNPKK